MLIRNLNQNESIKKSQRDKYVQFHKKVELILERSLILHHELNSLINATASFYHYRPYSMTSTSFGQFMNYSG